MTTRERIASVARGLSEREIFVLTIVHEAASEGKDGMTAVAHVIRNRANRGDGSYRTACLRPWAFSCWLPDGGAENHSKLVEHANLLRVGQMPPALTIGDEIVRSVMAGESEDITNGSDHYYAPKLMPNGKPPSWAVGVTPTATIGGHVFLKLRPESHV